MAQFLPILIFVSLIAAIAGSAATYQGSPKGKKWRCGIPLLVYVIVVLGAAFVTGFMTGRRMIDVETSRVIMVGALLLASMSGAAFYFKYR